MFQAQVPGFLQNMDKIPVDMTLEGMDAFRRAQQADEIGLADLNRQHMFDVQNDPLKLREQSLRNETSEAQLPGLQALSAQHQLNLQKQQKTQGPEIESLLSKHGYEKTKAWLDQFNSLGTIMRNGAAMLKQNPLGGKLQVKNMFHQSGHGDLWNPQWDSMDPAQLVQTLSTTGKEIQENSEKYSLTMDQAALKGEMARRAAEEKAASAERQTLWRINSARQLKQIEFETKRLLQTPNYQELSARYADLALDAKREGKLEEAREYDAEALRLNQAAMALPAVSGNVANQGKVDPSALTGGAVPTVNPGRATNAQSGGMPPRAAGPAPAASAPKKPRPTSASEAQKMGWVLQRDAKGNKAFVSPDNTDFFEVK